MDARVEPGLFRHLVELSIAEVVVEGHATLRAIVSQKQIKPAVSIVVEKAGTGPRAFVFNLAANGSRSRNNPRFLGHIHKLHFDLRRRLQRRLRRLDRARVLALFTVSQAHGRSDFILRYVLKALEMLAGVVDVTGLLVSARQSKLSGGVQRIDFQRVLQRIDSLRKLLGLHVGGAEKIPRVGVVRINLSDTLERIDRGWRVAAIFREQAEAV